MAQTAAALSEAIKDVFRSSVSDISRDINRQVAGSEYSYRLAYPIKKGNTMTAKEHETEAKRIRREEKRTKQIEANHAKRTKRRDKAHLVALSTLTSRASNGDREAAIALLRWGR